MNTPTGSERKQLTAGFKAMTPNGQPAMVLKEWWSAADRFAKRLKTAQLPEG